MELYNESKKYSHPNIDNLMNGDLTCAFAIKIYNNIDNNFKLIDKSETGELFIMLTKQNQISIYYGNKIKKQITSNILETNKWYHIIFVRSITSSKNYLYVDGKLNSATHIVNKDNIDLTLIKTKIYTGGIDYKMNKIRLYNYPMNINQIKILYLYDTHNKSGILQLISNRLNETIEINTGVSHGFILEDIIILYTKHQLYLSQKNYPLDTYIKYNLERYEYNIPQILTMLVMRTDDLHEKFDLDEIANNLVTWQFGMHNEIYSKNINNNNNIGGYWVEKEVSMFVPYTGKGVTYVMSDGNIAENKGTFQSGNMVSFIKIIINNFIKTKKSNLLQSIHKFIDYLIDISHNYNNGGIPLYHPKLDDDLWKYNISIKNGNFINYLRSIEIILNSQELLSHIESKIDQLKNAYKKSLILLLKLQINVDSTKTIWCQYYDKDTLLPVDGNENEPVGLCTLESAQILLFLMNIENPTNSIKDTIHTGCNWFYQNKISGWMQIFDKKNYNINNNDENTEYQTLILEYNYKPFPEKMTLHSRYYDFNSMAPIFKENNKLYDIESFNNMSVDYRNSEYHMGMWGHYLIEAYEEWCKMYNI
jgi:PelA/Pel-15E family pectate lyase